MTVKTAFNERFYFLVELRAGGSHDIYETPVVGDIYEACAKYLRWLALEDDTHKRVDTIQTSAIISVGPDGPWELVCIAPGWRQCEPLVQDIIERVLLAKHWWATDYLLEADTESFEAAMASVGGYPVFK